MFTLEGVRNEENTSAREQLFNNTRLPDQLVQRLNGNVRALKLLENQWKNSPQSRRHIQGISAFISHEGVLQRCQEFLDDRTLGLLTIGAWAHDTGKGEERILAVVEKPGPLTAGEEQVKKEHPRVGFEALSSHDLAMPPEDAEIIRLMAYLHHFSPNKNLSYGGSEKVWASLDGYSRFVVRLMTLIDHFSAGWEPRLYRSGPVDLETIILTLCDRLGPPSPEEIELIKVIADYREKYQEPFAEPTFAYEAEVSILPMRPEKPRSRQR
ncbi:hypothetical protein M1403_03285 [Patescibacteria group bacterium]|nr:hypothetical protein [Patescibacteria group bacterium]